MAGSTKPASVVALLKLHLSDLGFDVPEPTESGAALGLGTANNLDCFLFRDIRKVHKSHKGSADTEYSLGDGQKPMDSTSYKYYLERLRACLQDCCGYDEHTADIFGTHSMRRGGDTMLFDAGVDQQHRQLLGLWRTATAEIGYVGYSARQHMSWAKACAI